MYFNYADIQQCCSAEISKMGQSNDSRQIKGERFTFNLGDILARYELDLCKDIPRSITYNLIPSCNNDSSEEEEESEALMFKKIVNNSPINYQNSINISALINEAEKQPNGHDISSNIQHIPLVDTSALQKINIGAVIGEVENHTNQNSLINYQNSINIGALINEAEKQPNGHDISSNIQHIPLVETSSPQKIDIRSAIAEIEKAINQNGKHIPDYKGAIQKNSVTKAISDVAKTLARNMEVMVYQKKLYVYKSPIWVNPNETDFMEIIRERMPDQDILSYLSTKGFIEIYMKLLTDPNLQVSEDEVNRHKNWIVCTDGIIDSYTGKILEPNPRYFNFTYSNISTYELGRGNGEVFEHFIANCTGGDQGIRQLILEVIGIILSGYTPKAIFLLLGDKNTGKTQFTQFLRLLVGEMNSESVQSLNEFSERWTTGRLQGKKLCICPDVPKEQIKPQALATIKQLVGGDLVSADQKYKAPFSFVNEAKLVFASNHRLQIRDSENEDAFLDRIITIPFKNSISKDKMIPDVSYQLLQDKGYIVKISIEALMELQLRNFVFTKVEIPDFYEESQSLDDNIIDFCEENCIFDTNLEVATYELHAAYVAFCREKRVQNIKDAVFARTLSKNYPDLERLRNAKGSGQRGFRGIALRYQKRGGLL